MWLNAEIPTIIAATVVAFPVIFFLKLNIVIRLLLGYLSVIAFMYAFGFFMAHEFDFWNVGEVLGQITCVILAWGSASGLRTVLKLRR